MKRLTPWLAPLALLTTATIIMHQSPAFSESPKEGQVLRHMVIFKFKADAPQPKVDEVVKAFAALPKKIDAIHDFEWGKEDSVENLTKGFTHCFLVTFKSKEDLEAYLPHPAHQDFVKLIRPVIDDVMVMDYWAQN